MVFRDSAAVQWFAVRPAAARGTKIGNLRCGDSFDHPDRAGSESPVGPCRAFLGWRDHDQTAGIENNSCNGASNLIALTGLLRCSESS